MPNRYVIVVAIVIDGVVNAVAAVTVVCCVLTKTLFDREELVGSPKD